MGKAGWLAGRQVAGQRSRRRSEVRPEVRTGGIASIIIIITINWLQRGEGFTRPGCRRKGHTAKI